MSIQRQTIRRVLNDPQRCQDVVGHRLIFCESVLTLPTDERILECECCGRFLVYCCSCTGRWITENADSPSFSTDFDSYSLRPCHHYKLAFVDGACLGNGKNGATAGIGIAIGADSLGMEWAIPIDDFIDPSSIRTSQRAELLAAINGIRKLGEYQCPPVNKPHNGRAEYTSRLRPDTTWVIASDSEYVVSGITEWVPTWKNKGWHNSSGRRPKNLDLFRTLDATVEQYEREYDVQIAFWRISREHNMVADELAEIAARGQTLEEFSEGEIDSIVHASPERRVALDDFQHYY